MRLRFPILAFGAVLGLSLALPASAQNPQRHEWIQPPSGLPNAGHGEPSIKLDTLFEALKIAPDDDSAKAIEDRIWALWVVSGSDTCNLLMSRVKAATDDKDYDLAIKLLDAVIDIKPDYVEAWNRRATVYFMKKDFGHSLADIREVLAREPRHFGAPTKAMRTMLVAPGVPSGTPATMMTRWPALAKPSLKAMRQARSTMSSWSCASSATTQCTPQTSDSLRPVARLGEIATIGGFGRSRATRSPVEPENVQHTMAGEIERLGDLPRRRRDGVGAGRLGLGALRMDDGAVDRVALHLLGDAVHGGDRLDRILPGRRFRRQHDGVGALEDGGRHVGHLGAGRHRAGDHRFQHLGRDHHRLAGAPRAARHLLLDARHLLQRHLDAEVAARHHHGVGEIRGSRRAGSPPAASRSWPSRRRGRA